MSRKGNALLVMAGVLLGIAISGPAAHAAAEYITAIRSTQTFYLDGRQIKLEAYAINGNNYVKLRDVGQAVNFNVTYDGAANSVQIVTDEPYSEDAPALTPTDPQSPAAYTISADHWSREDFSQGANPAVFTGVYDRALYNAIRQTLVDGGSSSQPAYTMVSKEDYSAVKNLLGRLEGVLRYEHYVPQNFTNYWKHLDYFAVSATIPENCQSSLDFIQPVIAQAERLGTERERVEYLNDYLCTLLKYDLDETAGVPQTFSPHSGELPAACGSYARAFKFLCGAADIPCFTIGAGNHVWNMVYAEGRWLHVDVSDNDATHSHTILLAEALPSRTDEAPEATAFLKELLVPGSTK